MTSKLIVNNIEADAGVSTITFGSEISASKITTSSTSEFSSGLNVTGTLTCDGITSDGDVTIRAATGNLYIKDTDNDGVVAVQRIVGRDSLDNDDWILGQTSTSNSNITLGNVNNAEIIFRTNDTDRLQLSGDGSILYPTTTNAMDIGGSSNQFRNAYFDGVVNCDGLSCNGTATITANAGVLEIQDNNNDGVAAQQRINGIDSLSNIDWYLGQTSNTNSDIHLNNVNNNAIVFSTNNAEKLRIDSSGRLLVGAISDGTGRRLQVEGTDYSNSTLSVRRESDDAGGSALELYKSRGSSFNIVSDDDQLGYIRFYGSQGSADAEAARIRVDVDGTTSSTAMPGRLMFFTTPSGSTSPTERMRITSAGYVSIGGANTNPSNPLVVNHYGDGTFSPTSATEQVSKAGLIVNPDSNNSSAIFSVAKHSTGATLLQASNGSGSSVYNLVACPFGAHFLIHTTGLPGPSVKGAGFYKDSNNTQLLLATSSTSAIAHVEFFNTNGKIGTITTSGTSTSYNTSSDYRLKENVVDLDGAITRVKQLAPKRFNFIADETDTAVDGFLAHEAQSVVPEAVTGTHDEVDDDGNAVMQGIDQSKLVPLLTAALQEAISKIETLEAKVAALENP